jgi:hypothetical protein
MAPIRSKKISKPTQMQAPEKIFISKLKGNDQIITPLSQLKELASEKNSYHTIKGEIESVKHIIYKVAYTLLSMYYEIFSIRLVLNAVAA